MVPALINSIFELKIRISNTNTIISKAINFLKAFILSDLKVLNTNFKTITIN
jgi:hypothetical protein